MMKIMIREILAEEQQRWIDDNNNDYGCGDNDGDQ